MNRTALDFRHIIDAIDLANDQEIQAIGRVESAIENLSMTPVAPEPVKVEVEVKPAAVAEEKEKAPIFDPYNTVATSSGKPSYSAPASVMDEEPTSENKEPEKSLPVNNSSTSTTANTDNSVSALEQQTTVNNIRTEAPVISDDRNSINIEPSETVTLQSEQVKVTEQTNKLIEGLWRDTQGRLRNSRGAFASAEQKELIEKMGRTEGKDKERSNNVFTTIAKTFSSFVNGGNAKGEALDAAGSTSGGVYWAAAKEFKELSDSLSETKDTVKDSKVFSSVKSFLGFKSTDNTSSISADNNTQESVNSDSNNSSRFKLKESSKGVMRSLIESRFPMANKMYESVFNRSDTSSESIDSAQSNETKSITNSVVNTSTAQANKDQKLQLEQDRKQEDQQLSDNKDILDGIYEVKDAIDAISINAGGSGSILDLADDVFGGRDDKSKSNKGKTRGGRVKSIMDGIKNSKVGSGASKLAGGASLLSKLAIPLTAITAGVSRYNEVKNDEELTTTQKTTKVAATSTGAVGGALAGAATGAAFGSFIPVIGTAVGGFIGAAVGGWLGAKGGDYVGDSISNAIADDSTTSTSNVVNNTPAVDSVSSQTAPQLESTAPAALVMPPAVNTYEPASNASNQVNQASGDTARPKIEVINTPDPQLAAAIQRLNENMSNAKNGEKKITNNGRTTITPSNVGNIPLSFTDAQLQILAMDVD